MGEPHNKNCSKKKRTKKKALKKIVETYNGIYHRGIGMLPNEALRNENWENVRINSLKYMMEFRKYNKKRETLQSDDEVLIRNEFKSKKMDDTFNKEGKIIKREYGDVYTVKQGDGKVLKKHISQLKRLRRGKLDHAKND